MRRESLKKKLGLLSALVLFGCQSEVTTAPTTTSQASEADELRILTQQIGEGSPPLYTPGEGIEPDYRARVMALFYNRLRVAPHLYGLTYENPPMSGMMFPYIPVPPARLDAFMTEPGRWMANFQRETGCNCDAAAVGYDPMDPDTREQEKLIGAACCNLEVIGGVAQCNGPLVTCLDPQATTRVERRAKLNQGISEIADENIIPLGMSLPPDAMRIFQASQARNFVFSGLSRNGKPEFGSAVGASIIDSVETPEECLPKPVQCPAGGECLANGSAMCDTAANPNCLGLCVGGVNDGDPCVLEPPAPEMPPECDPDTFPHVETLVVATGRTQAPVAVLNDGIHLQIADDHPLVNSPNGIAFPATPEGSVSFAVHYYETNGAPVGTPQSMQVVIEGSCNTMAPQDTPDVLPLTGAAAPYAGDLYTFAAPLTAGCHPYVFVAHDGVGFEYTYPTYGALQAKVDAEGKVALNDESCPIWTDTRPSLSCVPTPQECNNGETRPCYTGLYGTQDNGSCALGQETCQGGRWSGSCQGQVLPEAEEICHDGIDNDCNGGIDEGCFCNYLDNVEGVCFQAPRNTERECVAPETYESEETLCDGLDNDCDGVLDEGCPCDFQGNGEGVCTTAMSDNVGTCLEPQGYEQAEASCDGIDNDCDGATDENCACNFLDSDKGVCAMQRRDEQGTCPQPETYEEKETQCDGRDNDCNGQIDEGCASSCDDSRDCRWEDGHGCEGRTTAGEKFCTTAEGDYRAERNAPATTNPQCVDDSDCNGVCDPFGLKCVDTAGNPSSPSAASGDDTCGSPQDCPVGYFCTARDGIRQCVTPNGDVLEDDDGGCNCGTVRGKTPTHWATGIFGLFLIFWRRRRTSQERSSR